MSLTPSNQNTDAYSYIVGPVIVNETEAGLSSMWKGGELAEKYKDFAAKLPSDIPAYKAVSYLVEQILVGKLAREGKNVSDATVLDFGCYDGSCSAMYAETGAKIVGIDKNPEVIREASERFKDQDRFSFLTVEDEASIPLPENSVDLAVLTFVHPTIDTLEGLFSTFEKIYRVLKAGGVIILLGLNPESFDPNLHFVSYGHNTINPDELIDGGKFTNHLVLPDGSVLEFPDSFWANGTIEYVLSAKGFINTKFFPLRDSLEGPVGDSLRRSLRERPDLRGIDEWGHPGLHQVITSAKPNGYNNYLPDTYEG